MAAEDKVAGLSYLYNGHLPLLCILEYRRMCTIPVY